MGTSSWHIRRRGHHLETDSAEVRRGHGIDPLFLRTVVVDMINRDYKPMQIVEACEQLKTNSVHSQALKDSKIPNITQISNYRSMMKKNFQGVFAFEHIDAVETEAKKYLRSKEEFDRLADDDPSQITLKVLNEFIRDTARGELVPQYAYTFTTKGNIVFHSSYGHNNTFCLASSTIGLQEVPVGKQTVVPRRRNMFGLYIQFHNRTLHTR